MRAATSVAAAATLAAAVTSLLLLARRWRRQGSLEALLRAGKKAVCVGKNYRDHITELAQMDPVWQLGENPEPILFLKPTTSYAWPGEPLVLPPRRGRSGMASVHGVHHELELGVIVGRACKGLTDEAEAMRCVAGFVLGLDITERDEQTVAKTKGMPWSVCKGYDSFLPLSAPFSLAPGEDWRALRLWLSVNGEQRQACEAGAMITSVPQLLCFISSVMSLEPRSKAHTLPRLAARPRGTARPACLPSGQPSGALAAWMPERERGCGGAAGVACPRSPSTAFTHPPPPSPTLHRLRAPRPGDLVLTGTPSGVGRLLPGDAIAAGVAGHVEMAVAVVAS